jgi:hypothetical protein
MHKQEIIEAYCQGDDNVGAEQYYNETYGSKGSDEIKPIEKESYPEFPDRIWLHGDGRKLTSSKQEISDEEIEEEIHKRYMNPIQDYAWRDACKWYREQLKTK